MDKYIKQSVDSRKGAIFNAYKVGAAEKKKIDSLFVEIEKLGAKCKDVGEFEAELAKSPLNQKYLDLFTEIATSCQPATSADMSGVKKPSIGGIVAEGVVEGVADRAVTDAMHATMPTRAAVNQKVYDEARKVPGVGDAISAGQNVSYAAHLAKVFGKRKKK